MHPITLNPHSLCVDLYFNALQIARLGEKKQLGDDVLAALTDTAAAETTTRNLGRNAAIALRTATADNQHATAGKIVKQWQKFHTGLSRLQGHDSKAGAIGSRSGGKVNSA